MAARTTVRRRAGAFALGLALTLSGCAKNSMNEADRTRAEGAAGGSVIGAVLGAGIGAALGGRSGALRGAAIGAAAGALAGFAVGEEIARRKERYASTDAFYDAQLVQTAAYIETVKQSNTELALNIQQIDAGEFDDERESVERQQKAAKETLVSASQELAVQQEVLKEAESAGFSQERLATMRMQVQELESNIALLDEQIGAIKSAAVETEAQSSETARELAKLPRIVGPFPRPSSRTACPTPTEPSLSSYRAQIDAALNRVGHSERSYFRFRDGFAIVSRIERIHEDGAPFKGAERWPDATLEQDVSILDYIANLFVPQPGFYRFAIISTASIEPQVDPGKTLTPKQGSEILQQGSVTAPEFSDAPVAPGLRCVILIYEFEKKSLHAKVAQRFPSAVDVKRHASTLGFIL